VIVDEEIFMMNIPMVLDNFDLKSKEFLTNKNILVRDMEI
jgi:hypothetical protein